MCERKPRTGHDVEDHSLRGEEEYLDLVREVIEKGVERKNERTGTGTMALFGRTCRYDLTGGKLPLFTTKQVSFKNVLVELIFFLRGKSHVSWLRQNHCHIWDGNSSREYLDSVGLNHYPEGTLGPVYGCLWRNFGGDYQGADVDTGDSQYGENKGIDQLAHVIEQLKTNPESRRHVVVAWNPSVLDKVALPACHTLFQFFVDDDQLSCLMYQRSADLGLGVPYNVASYSLLTHIVAHLTGLRAKEFVHVMGDAHVYVNHVPALRQQLERTPLPCPKVTIAAQLQHLDGIEISQVDVKNYKHHGKLSMKMAV
jgi:thymidylate synthase